MRKLAALSCTVVILGATVSPWKRPEMLFAALLSLAALLGGGGRPGSVQAAHPTSRAQAFWKYKINWNQFV